ncbi:MAG: UDP-N-acetylmuramate--L-alanine ligase, partial [Anaerolineales bacterium]|nr:UDP-N-acetylmuramate--L-alanine ligase [Anaerolineales bacterium]
GIGGSGLSAIARVLLERGELVSGSDMAESTFLDGLRDLGAQVTVGHAAENIRGAEAVIVSSAVAEENVEVVAARRAGLPVYKRSEFFGPLTQGKRTVAVSGTHGKTTTTGEIAHLLVRQGLDPSFIAGGALTDFGGSNARAGKGDYFVIEADEYDRAFLGLSPWIAVLTNIEHDHPDCYPTIEDLQRAFAEFLDRVQPGGSVVVCADSPGAIRVVDDFKIRHPKTAVYTYAVDMEADWQATQIQANTEGGSDFLATRGGVVMGRVRVRLPGMHNVCNSLAALCTADLCGIPFSHAAKFLAQYHGAERRFEIMGEACGITVVDDYAHHPSEIRATLSAARQRYPESRIWAVWQPHTYSRTRVLEKEFVQAFGEATKVVVLPVYRAREPMDASFPIEEVVGAMTNTEAVYIPGLMEAVPYLTRELRCGDVLVMLSAGDANRVGEEVLRRMRMIDAERGTAIRAPILPLEKLRRQFGNRMQEEVPLGRLTTAKVGGLADALLEVQSADELAQAAAWLWREEIPFFVLGSGSNTLISDAGCRDLVIYNRARRFEFRPGKNTSKNSVVVWAESGASIGAIARQTAQLGWTGLEWAATVPGTVGGAVVGNAGAFGGDTAGMLRMVEILQRMESPEKTGVSNDRRMVEPETLNFSYRSSMLRKHPGQAVVLSVEFVLSRCEPSEAVAKVGELLARRRATQPTGASLGSMFRNPPGDYAGRLIEAAGLKGYRMGNVEISQQHANFFVNLGDGRAEDIRSLMNLARATVLQKFGVELEEEIVMAGDWPEALRGNHG